MVRENCSKDQIFAIALIFRVKTDAPFLWVLRFPRFSDREEMILPEGFETRTRDRGIIYTGWAPQLHILAHSSVGGFLSHSGWSSVLEAVKFGVRLALLPMGNDQELNARFVVEELGVGVEVEKLADGSFTTEQIRSAVVKIMKEEDEGRSLKCRIGEVRKSIFGESGCEEICIQRLIRILSERRGKLNNGI